MCVARFATFARSRTLITSASSYRTLLPTISHAGQRPYPGRSVPTVATRPELLPLSVEFGAVDGLIPQEAGGFGVLGRPQFWISVGEGGKLHQVVWTDAKPLSSLHPSGPAGGLGWGCNPVRGRIRPLL